MTTKLQWMRQQLANRALKHAGVGRDTDVGQRGGGQEEAAIINILRADAPVPARFAFILLARETALHQLAHGRQREYGVAGVPRHYARR